MGRWLLNWKDLKNFTNEPILIFLYESKVSWDTEHILRKCPKFFLFVTELLLKWSIQIYGCSYNTCYVPPSVGSGRWLQLIAAGKTQTQSYRPQLIKTKKFKPTRIADEGRCQVLLCGFSTTNFSAKWISAKEGEGTFQFNNLYSKNGYFLVKNTILSPF